MILFKKIRFLIFALPFLAACGSSAPHVEPNWLEKPWSDIEAAAKGSTVRLMMWQGDPQINAYMHDWLAPALEKKYGVHLDISSGQGNELVKLLLSEKEAGRQQSSIDLCWINGETFFQLREIQALYGPFIEKLPNAQFIDLQNPFIGQDFQQPVNGYECPWGNVQLALIYDSLRTPVPPRTLEALAAYCAAHPGKFTIPYHFTGITLLKSWLIGLSGDKNTLNGPFDEAKYQALSQKLWDYLRANKANFWRKGATYPESVAAMHQMFANGELDFTMSNNDNEADNKILQHVLPGSSKSFVFESGTIQNSHYMGIPAHATNVAGALVALNFMISPEAQYQKMQPGVWGDGTVLDSKRLPEPWKTQFEQLPARLRGAIQPYALQEPAPEYMIRLFADFKKYLIEQ